MKKNNKLIKKIAYIIFYLLISLNMSFAQNKFLVKFVVISENYKYTDSIYITGNNTELGNWHPSKVPMQKTSENRWEKEIYFEKDTSIEFKFTRGEWDNEAVNEQGAVPVNHHLWITKDTTLFFSINHWKDEFENISKTQVTGIVKYHRSVKGEGIKPRDIVVWLPPIFLIPTHPVSKLIGRWMKLQIV